MPHDVRFWVGLLISTLMLVTGINLVSRAQVNNPQTNATALTTGTLPAGRMPALTGDITTSAGAVATTLAAGSAANLNSGTLPSARISGSYTGITGTGTLTAGATGAGFTVALTTSTVTGTLPDAQFPTTIATQNCASSCSALTQALAGVRRVNYACGVACTIHAFSGGVIGNVYAFCFSNSNNTIDTNASYLIGGANLTPVVASGNTCYVFLAESATVMRQISVGANST